MPYFHSATFALNVPPNFIVSSLIFAFVSDTEDGAKKLFVNNVAGQPYNSGTAVQSGGACGH